MKKIFSVLIALFINFVLICISGAFYATDPSGGFTKGVSLLPVSLFYVGFFVYPWYMLKKDNFTLGYNQFLLLLFTFANFSMWSLVALTEGFFEQKHTLIALFCSFFVPFISNLFYPIKLKYRIKKPTSTKFIHPFQKKELPLASITELIAAMPDSNVKDTVHIVLASLEKSIKHINTLGIEEIYTIERLITTDIPHVLHTYLSLRPNLQREKETEVIEHVLLMDAYLQSVLEGVSAEQLVEYKKTMELIGMRYEK